MRWLAGVIVVAELAGPVPGQIEVNRPRSVFECDTPVGASWYGSAERCLAELCAGGNVTNAHVIDGRGRLRRNPCYGRDPYELSR
jgi:hypothetical protein